VFWLCFWKPGLCAANPGCFFGVTNVRMYMKKGYAGVLGAYAPMRIALRKNIFMKNDFFSRRIFL
jgi:hypothetical protein